MNQPIHTTKGTNKSYIAMNIVFDTLLYGYLGIWLINQARKLSGSFFLRSTASKLYVCAFVVLGFLFVLVIYHASVCATYLEIFEGRMAGSGLNGWQRQSFDLKMDQIVSLSSSTGFLGVQSSPGVFLIVSTSVGNYKVITTKERAAELVSYFANLERV